MHQQEPFLTASVKASSVILLLLHVAAPTSAGTGLFADAAAADLQLISIMRNVAARW
jgi:hypothetical protein